MTPLLAFWKEEAPDHQGRRLDDILRHDDDWLERTHDFVQWLFPLRERSGANPSAPRLTPDVEAAFHADAALRARLLDAFDRMLAFYGLRRHGTEIVKGANWDDRRDDWFTRPTHNDLRITRIMKSLSLLGWPDQAKALLACLEALRRTEPDCGFSPVALRHWRQATRDA